MPLDPSLSSPRAAPGSPHVTAGPATFVVLLAQTPATKGLWHMQRFLFGRFGLRRVAGMRFHKVLGSGHEGGFGLRPSFTRHGVMAFFSDETCARAFLVSSFVDGYRKHATELFCAALSPVSCRGSWSGFSLDLPTQALAPETPVAALTRGSIHPLRAPLFWSKAAPAQAAVEHAPGCQLAVGLGEAPLFRQATFSLWDSVAAMDAYARHGAHLAAIKASHQQGFFTESMFLRGVPRHVHGTWKGKHYG
jgi:hypothetical protein